MPASNGDTPLIAASRVGFTGAIEVLLALGAKIDAANRMGETPLIVAVQQREPDVVKMLLARGANPDKKRHGAGLSARDYARRDTRNRDILAVIEAAGKPTPATKKDDPTASSCRRQRSSPRLGSICADSRRAARLANRSSSALRRAGASGRCAASRISTASYRSATISPASLGRNRSPSQIAARSGGTAQKKRSQ